MENKLTPAQRAGQTTHRRAVERKERWQAELAEKEAIHKALLSVVNDPKATAGDKLGASFLLLELNKK